MMLYHQESDFPVLSIVEALPKLVRNTVSFLWTPKEFTTRWMQLTQDRISGWAVLASCLAIVSLLYGIYAIVFKTTPLHRMFPSPPHSNGEVAQQRVKPRFVAFGFKTREVGLGTGGVVISETNFNLSPLPSFRFPEGAQKGIEEPQLLLFSAGIINVLVADVVPAGFASKTGQTLFAGLFALITTLCLFPAAFVLGSRTIMAEVFGFTLTAFSYSALWGATLVLAAVLLVVDILRIDPVKKIGAINSPREIAVFFLVSAIWNALVFVPPCRSLYVAYRVVFGFNNLRMWAAMGLSFFLSAVVAPLVFIPALYIWLKGREVIERLA